KPKNRTVPTPSSLNPLAAQPSLKSLAPPLPRASAGLFSIATPITSPNFANLRPHPFLLSHPTISRSVASRAAKLLHSYLIVATFSAFKDRPRIPPPRIELQT